MATVLWVNFGAGGDAVKSQKITPARSIRLDLKSPELRKCANQFGSHGHVGRFLRVVSLDFDAPPSSLRAQQQRGSELRAFLDADTAPARSRSATVNHRG